MKPPYGINNVILTLLASISEKIGAVKATHLHKPATELRKKNRIKTIHSSLAIEGNTLSADQVTAILENKRILAPAKDITEVKNAIAVYELLNELDPYSIRSICKAHKILMRGLVDMPGKFRTKGVGIAKGAKLTHVAPPGNMIPSLMKDLFTYLKKDKDLLILKSCVFHYEFEFIHPFMDGNGRIGRLWQTLILKEYSPVFEYLPVETLIKEKQKKYYAALSISDKLGSSTPFIEFMLCILDEALEQLLTTQNRTLSALERINLFKDMIGTKVFTRQMYLRQFKEISSATASRDLKTTTAEGMLIKKGDKRFTEYKFKKA